MTGLPDLIQVCNPKTKRFVLVDKAAGAIVKHKRTKGPYANVRILGKRYDLEEPKS